MNRDYFNLFFAVFPNRDVAQKIEALAVDLRKAHGLKGEPLPAHRLHVSLVGLGSGYSALPAEIVEKACLAGYQLSSPPFQAAFSRTESFDRKSEKDHPFVLSGGDGLDALRSFRATLHEAVKRAGLGRLAGRSGFTPHVTLLYADRLLSEEYPVSPPVSWTVEEFALVWSHVGKKRYKRLGEWRLKS